MFYVTPPQVPTTDDKRVDPRVNMLCPVTSDIGMTTPFPVSGTVEGGVTNVFVWYRGQDGTVQKTSPFPLVISGTTWDSTISVPFTSSDPAEKQGTVYAHTSDLSSSTNPQANNSADVVVARGTDARPLDTAAAASFSAFPSLHVFKAKFPKWTGGVDQGAIIVHKALLIGSSGVTTLKYPEVYLPHLTQAEIPIPVPILGAGHYYLSQIFFDGLNKPQHFVHFHKVT